MFSLICNFCGRPDLRIAPLLALNFPSNMSTTDPISAADPRRFRELDSLRGVAALTVVFYHFSRICPPHVDHILLHTPLRLFVAGHQAVILFFLLSGFVLTLPHQKRAALNYGSFLLKRVCRIYLPYLGALTLAILCDKYFARHSAFNNYWLTLTWTAPVTTHLVMQHILFLGNYDWSQFNTAFWSLVYEMRISLLFPFMALAVLRLRAAWMILSALLLSLTSLPLAPLLSRALPLSHIAAINSTLTLHYAAFFILGSLMAKHLHAINRRYARLGALQSALLALIALLLYTLAGSSSIIQRFSIPNELYDWPVALGAMMLIVLAMNSRPFHLFLTSPAIHHLGEISYSLYLLHGTVLFTLVHTIYGRVSIVTLLLVYLAITLVVTGIFYRLVERPTMLLGRRLAAPRKITSASQRGYLITEMGS
jgi:peptidoglycan/LPS O-acetylase OafA/YrhL